MAEMEAAESINVEAGTSPLPEEKPGLREPSLLLQAVLCVLAALEGADNQLLGASLKYTSFDLSFTFDALQNMSIAQGVAANLGAPFWGVAADRGLFRQKDLMTVAALGQGFVTVLLAFSPRYGATMIFLRALNGLFLAGLRPIANGVVAKTTDQEVQGKIFSRIFSFVLLGGSVASLVVTPWSGIPYIAFGVAFNGWRVAWALVGGMSVAAAVFTQFAFPANEVRRNGNESMLQAVVGEMKLMLNFCCIPTFCAMVGQGTFGTIPWTVLWIGTRYYQAGNLDDFEAGLVASWQPIISMPGVIIGGFLADKAANRWGFHGRPIIAQVTVALAIPIMYLNFVGIPPENGGPWTYIAVITMFGLFCNWAQGGVNWPILSSIVPEDVRSRVMAVEGALENSLATILGPVFLNQLAKRVFKFDLTDLSPSGGDYDNARILGLALCITVCIPWLLAYVVYSLLHITYPRDMRKLQAAEALAGPKKRGSKGSLASYLSSRSASRGDMHI